MSKKIFFILFLPIFLTVISYARNTDTLFSELKPTAQQELIALEVANLVQNYSYKKVIMNDSLSSIIFSNLLKSIDPDHIYFLQSDIDEMKFVEKSISQDLKIGNLSGPFFVYNRFLKRFIENLEYSLTQIDVPYDSLTKERYVINRKNYPWFKTYLELQEHWHKRVQYDLNNLSLADNDTAHTYVKYKEILSRRYKNMLIQAKKVNASDAFQLIMKAFTDGVDPHTAYFNSSFAESFNQNLSNTLYGIGLQMIMENEILTIKEVMPGGPAYLNGNLHVNDRIIAVAQGDGEFEDIIGWRQDDAVDKIKGQKGSIVRMKVIPAGMPLSAAPTIITLKRDKIVLTEESAKKEIRFINGIKGKTFKIGIIKLPKFYFDMDAFARHDSDYKSTTRDVRLILDSLNNQKVDAIILDLRNNGGGSLQEVISLAGLFIDKGVVVQMRDASGKVQMGKDETPGVNWNGPLGVLINRFSASASEIFAGVIQDYGRGLILGSPSYGKGTIQSIVDMSKVISPKNIQALNNKLKSEGNDVTNEALKFGQINITIGKFYRITGSSTQLKGITPDIVFPSQYTSERFGESSIASALPWDQIAPSDYAQIADLSSVIKKLNLLHSLRMKKSLEYKYMLDDINNFNKHYDTYEVSLNRNVIKKEHEKAFDIEMERTNNLLKLHGLKQWKKGEPKPQTNFDFVLDESVNIMRDYIEHE